MRNSLKTEMDRPQRTRHRDKPSGLAMRNSLYTKIQKFIFLSILTPSLTTTMRLRHFLLFQEHMGRMRSIYANKNCRRLHYSLHDPLFAHNPSCTTKWRTPSIDLLCCQNLLKNTARQFFFVKHQEGPAVRVGKYSLVLAARDHVLVLQLFRFGTLCLLPSSGRYDLQTEGRISDCFFFVYFSLDSCISS